MDRPVRKTLRLKGYDYSTPGAYFLTVCTRDRRCILSDIVPAEKTDVGEGLAPPAVKLTSTGRIAEEQILSLEERFSGLSVDGYVIMPNHIHLLITLSGETGGASPAPTVTDAVRVLKSQTARLSGVGRLFQRSFYDHIVRNEAEYAEIAAYVETNPARWTEDRFHP